MTLWGLIRHLPAILALWQRMGRTPINDVATWGGLIIEAVAMLTRLGGVDVPPMVDVISVGTIGAGSVHKTAKAKDEGFSVDSVFRSRDGKVG